MSNRRQAGFTLVEVIVMMAVLSIGILGTLAVANLAVQSSDRNQRQVIGVNLAREGVELVRAVRDSNWAAMAEETGPDCWDYYPDSQLKAGQPPPGACTPRFQSLSAATNFVAYLNTGNGSPYLVQQASTVTENAVYRLCPNAQGTYLPSAQACSSGGRTYYRRVTIQRAKDLGVDDDDNTRKYSILVRSQVTWPGQNAADLVIEEYLTDWRKF